MTIGEMIDRLRLEAESRGLMFRASYGNEAGPGERIGLSATDTEELGSFSMSAEDPELCLRVFTAALVEWKGLPTPAAPLEPCEVPGCVRVKGHPALHCTSDQIAKREDGVS